MRARICGARRTRRSASRFDAARGPSISSSIHCLALTVAPCLPDCAQPRAASRAGASRFAVRKVRAIPASARSDAIVANQPQVHARDHPTRSPGCTSCSTGRWTPYQRSPFTLGTQSTLSCRHALSLRLVAPSCTSAPILYGYCKPCRRYSLRPHQKPERSAGCLGPAAYAPRADPGSTQSRIRAMAAAGMTGGE